MTRQDAIAQIWSSYNLKAIKANVSHVVDAIWLNRESMIAFTNEIYDDFEAELTIATSDRTCENCIHKPEAGENYLEECGTCSRFYADNFEERESEK